MNKNKENNYLIIKESVETGNYYIDNSIPMAGTNAIIMLLTILIVLIWIKS